MLYAPDQFLQNDESFWWTKRHRTKYTETPRPTPSAVRAYDAHKIHRNTPTNTVRSTGLRCTQNTPKHPDQHRPPYGLTMHTKYTETPRPTPSAVRAYDAHKIHRNTPTNTIRRTGLRCTQNTPKHPDKDHPPYGLTMHAKYTETPRPTPSAVRAYDARKIHRNTPTNTIRRTGLRCTQNTPKHPDQHHPPYGLTMHAKYTETPRPTPSAVRAYDAHKIHRNTPTNTIRRTGLRCTQNTPKHPDQHHPPYGLTMHAKYTETHRPTPSAVRAYDARKIHRNTPTNTIRRTGLRCTQNTQKHPDQHHPPYGLTMHAKYTETPRPTPSAVRAYDARKIHRNTPTNSIRRTGLRCTQNTPKHPDQHHPPYGLTMHTKYTETPRPTPSAVRAYDARKIHRNTPTNTIRRTGLRCTQNTPKHPDQHHPPYGLTMHTKYTETPRPTPSAVRAYDAHKIHRNTPTNTIRRTGLRCTQNTQKHPDQHHPPYGLTMHTKYTETPRPTPSAVRAYDARKIHRNTPTNTIRRTGLRCTQNTQKHPDQHHPSYGLTIDAKYTETPRPIPSVVRTYDARKIHRNTPTNTIRRTGLRCTQAILSSGHQCSLLTFLLFSCEHSIDKYIN